MRRLSTAAAPSGLVSRLARPLPASWTGRAAAVRGLADTSNTEAASFKIIRSHDRNTSLRKPVAPVKRATQRRSAPPTGYPPKSRPILSSQLRKSVMDYDGKTAQLKCVTPSSGQKTFHTHDVASAEVRDVSVVTQAEGAGQTALRVVWVTKGDPAGHAEQEHVSEYDSMELLRNFAVLHVPYYPSDLPRRLWDRRTIEEALKPVSYADWMAADDGSNSEFYRGLQDLYQLGILIVDGVPDSENAVREIANQIGNIQQTFYGELFDVVSKPNAENVAYTNVFLCLHQDLLYMNDPPYIQLLHCLRNECDGGESLFCDSVQAAIDLQMSEPENAALLASHPVEYHYERNGHYYYNRRPVFELTRQVSRKVGLKDTILTHTAWSPPFQNTLRYPLALESTDSTPHQELPDKRLRSFAAASKSFSDRLEHPDNMLEVKLQAGQCVLFNNRRVLHGRRQFNTSDGTRWLKGTYIDEQTFHSRVTDMLRRGVNGTEMAYMLNPDVALSERNQVLRLKGLSPEASGSSGSDSSARSDS
ncbi:hypothetical protein SCUCBS95973_009814 [Sporothrix curviconia]|uniref:TauD/TfdA-like domain-containing protein n=1 Tax=Sporothrix curviconia TaxID=1260050 RepID=A0ABP0D0L5_9PEZI